MKLQTEYQQNGAQGDGVTLGDADFRKSPYEDDL
jgi:hypothetical protein